MASEAQAHVETLALREQFDTAIQQKDASTLGMWVFLITEVMFFGGMFMAYTVYRNWYPGPFGYASRSLDITLGAVNTAVLLCSSFTMVMAVRAGQLGKRKQILINLGLTLFLGFVFLGIKAVEWAQKFHEHHVPGPTFHMEGTQLQGQTQLFFSLYFAMTGLHALHMVVGAGLILGLMHYAYRGRYSSAYYTPIDMVGLYWHFVDIIWIFLFPLLYLINRH